MTPYDIRTLEHALTELASFFNRKSPSEMAVKVWLRRCKAIPIECMTVALEEWMATSPHFPTIDAIANRAQEIHARQRRHAEEAGRAIDGPHAGRPIPPHLVEQLQAILAHMTTPQLRTARENAILCALKVRDGEAMPPHYVDWARGELGAEWDAIVSDRVAA